MAKLTTRIDLRFQRILMPSRVGGVDVERSVRTSDIFLVWDQSPMPKLHEDNGLRSATRFVKQSDGFGSKEAIGMGEAAGRWRSSVMCALLWNMKCSLIRLFQPQRTQRA